jgi:hypothetical protein
LATSELPLSDGRQTPGVPVGAGVTGLAVNSTLPRPLLWPMFACTAELAVFQGVDWAARRASLQRLVPPDDLAAPVSVQSAGFPDDPGGWPGRSQARPADVGGAR